MRSGLLAVCLIFIPKLSFFIERGVITRATIIELAQGLAIASLMVVFNYAQHLHGEETRRIHRHRRQQEAKRNV
jgi:hypothetical protein